MLVGSEPMLKCLDSVFRCRSIDSCFRLTLPPTLVIASPVSSVIALKSSSPCRIARALTKHCTGVFCGIPSADSSALPNCSPVRSTSSADRSPPAIAIFTSPLPLPSRLANELPVELDRPHAADGAGALERVRRRHQARDVQILQPDIGPSADGPSVEGGEVDVAFEASGADAEADGMDLDAPVHHVQHDGEVIERHVAALDMRAAIAQVDVRPAQARHLDRRIGQQRGALVRRICLLPLLGRGVARVACRCRRR